MVVLLGLPDGFLNDLPASDQAAIREVVGKPVLLEAYDEDGRAELYFTDAEGMMHWIYVPARLIRGVGETSG